MPSSDLSMVLPLFCLMQAYYTGLKLKNWTSVASVTFFYWTNEHEDGTSVGGGVLFQSGSK
jgi:hypothetical protein